MTLLATTRRIALFLAFNILVVQALCWIAMKRYDSRLWGAGEGIGIVLNLNGGSDSWKIARAALEYLREGHSKPIYTELLLDKRTTGDPLRLHFALTSMLAYEPIDSLANRTGIDPDRLLTAIGWIFTVITIVGTAMLFERCLRQTHHPPDLPYGTTVRAFLVLAATLTFFPFIFGFAKGNWQVWINGLFAAALLAWTTGQKATSGVLLALMCLIKPHYSLFVVWAAVRREWRFAGACVATGLVGVLASVAIYGLAHNIDYLNALSFLSERGESYYQNQSVNGVLNRIMSLSDPVHYQNIIHSGGSPYPPYTPLVFWGALFTSAIIIAAALAWRSSDRTIDFCIMAVSCTIASPIAWTYHYGLLLPVYAVALAKSDDYRFLMWTAISYLLTSNFIVAINVLARTPFNPLQSYVLFGAAILLILLCRLSPREALVPLDAGKRS